MTHVLQKKKEQAHLAVEFSHSRVWRSEVCGNRCLGCSPGSRRRQRTLESFWLVESLEENTITRKEITIGRGQRPETNGFRMAVDFREEPHLKGRAARSCVC